MSRTKEAYGAIYIGAKAGIRHENVYAWRIIPSGGNLLIQRYDINTGWVTKSTITG